MHKGPSSPIPCSKRRAALARFSASALAAVAAFPSVADTFTWDGAGGVGSRNWSNAANWAGDAVPNNDGLDDIIFAGTVKLNPRANGGWDINSITFAPGAGAFVFSGLSSDEILLEGGGIVNNSSNLQTINQRLTLGANQTFNASSGDILFGGNIEVGSFNLTLSSAASRSITLGNLISGPGQLTKAGAGSLTLSGANTHSGGLVLSAGTVGLSSDSAAGSGAISLNGGTLQANGTRTIANNVSLGGGAIGGSDNLTLAGVVSGSSALTKNGSGTLRLASANSASGAVAVNAGTLALGANSALGGVSGITIAAGASLTLDANGGNLVNDAASITFDGGSLNANNRTETFGTMNLAGNGVLNLLDDSVDADLTFAGFGTVSGGSILTINGWMGGGFLSQNPGGISDRIFFGTTLTQQQLDSIFFVGGPSVEGKAFQLPSGEIIPVPEPSTWALLGASLAALPFIRRKRS